MTVVLRSRFLGAPPAAGGVTPDYFLDWGSVSPGTTDPILTENGKASERWGGTGSLAIVTAASVGVSGLPASITNVLQVDMGTGDFDWVMIRAPKIVTPAVGGQLNERVYLLNNIANSGPAGTIDFGSAYAATHPEEYLGSQGGISGDFDAAHTGCRPDGTFEYYDNIDSISSQVTPGGSGGANPPSVLGKFRWWRIEKKWIRTADVGGNARWTLHMRIYDDTGALVYSDADGLDNLWKWGSTKWSLNNTGLPVSTTSMSGRRFGINGGGSIAVGNRPQRQYWAGFAVSYSDWCGPHTVNG